MVKVKQAPDPWQRTTTENGFPKPDASLRDLYDRQHRIFRELYPRTKPLLRQ